MFPSCYHVVGLTSIDQEILTNLPNSEETKLHGPVNNAGIMAVEFAESTDGYESQFQAIVPYYFATMNIVYKASTNTSHLLLRQII